MIRGRRPGGPQPPPPPGGPSSSRPPSPFYVQVRGADGMIEFTVNDSGAVPDTGADAASRGPVTVGSVGSGPHWRVLSTARPSGGRTVVGMSLEDVDSTVRRLIVLESVIGAAVLAVLGVAGWWLVRRSLRPLRQIERTAAAMASGDLHERVPERPARTEVGALSAAINAMLGQIQRAFADKASSEAGARAAEETARESEERMRRFVADAGHELRTPLTTVRGFAELHRMGRRTSGRR